MTFDAFDTRRRLTRARFDLRRSYRPGQPVT